MSEKPTKTIAENRKARHDYFIHDSFEAGIVLTGTEIKSLRAGKANLKDSYAQIDKNAEIYLHNMHISEYEQGNRFNHDPLRTRKLLMHKEQITKLLGKIKEKGYSLIVLKLYFVRGKAKAQLALVTGKKLYDKRQDLAQKDAQRQIQQAQKERQQTV